MSEPQPKSTFLQEFTFRVKWAREAHGLTQEEVARLLLGSDGDPQGTYKQYERRSLMPHALIIPFCKICGIDMNWLYLAKGRGPKIAPKPPRKARSGRKPRRRAA